MKHIFDIVPASVNTDGWALVLHQQEGRREVSKVTISFCQGKSLFCTAQGLQR